MRASSRTEPCRSSLPVASPARCAASPSIHRVTSVRGGTATTSTEFDPAERSPLPVIDTARALEVLGEGEIEILGRIIGSSNHAMYCRVRLDCPEPESPLVVEAVYKPTAGERPLDDFPDETLS